MATLHFVLIYSQGITECLQQHLSLATLYGNYSVYSSVYMTVLYFRSTAYVLTFLYIEVHLELAISSSLAVDFVLKDPGERAIERPASKTEVRRELDIVPKPWEKSFHASMAEMARSLYVTNPTLRQVLNLWYKSYAQARFINTKSLLTHGEVLEQHVFQGAIMDDIESVKNVLMRG